MSCLPILIPIKFKNFIKLPKKFCQIWFISKISSCQNFFSQGIVGYFFRSGVREKCFKIIIPNHFQFSFSKKFSKFIMCTGKKCFFSKGVNNTLNKMHGKKQRLCFIFSQKYLNHLDQNKMKLNQKVADFLNSIFMYLAQMLICYLKTMFEKIVLLYYVQKCLIYNILEKLFSS